MENIKEYVTQRKKSLKNIFDSLDKKLTLAIIQVNNDKASSTYVKGKIKDAKELGVKTKFFKFTETVKEKDLIYFIKYLNRNKDIDGILVQMPLPKHINEYKIKLTISPLKDVDGFNPLSWVNPCTPQGIIEYLKSNHVQFRGKNAVVIGRSDIVGKPMARLLLNEDSTITLVHSKTPWKEQKRVISKADIIVVAVGKMNYLNRKFKYKKNAIIIDVGINRNEEGKLCGDAEKGLPVKYQSPVPGGVGLLTRLTIFENLIKLMK